MTQQFQPVFPPQPGPEPEKILKPRRGGTLIALTMVALIFGVMVGFTSGVNGKVVTPAEPGARVTAYGTGNATVAAEAPEAKEVVPAECIRALDEADKILVIFGETMTIVSDTFEAASNFDVDGLNRGAEKIGEQTDKITENEYATYSTMCRKA